MKKYFSFQWHLTDACDQRCKHCYIYSNNITEFQSMSFDNMKLVVTKIEKMCERLNRVPYFYITGGDPILHPHFWELLKLLAEKGYKFTILGNPFHLDYEVCKKLKSYGCEKYQMSIDGLQKNHDYFRKPGSFDCTIEKIKCIKKVGIKSVIMTTVSSKNLEDIPQLIDLVVEKEVDIYAFARYCPSGNEKSNGIQALEYRTLLDTVWKKIIRYKSEGVKTYFNLKDHLWNLYLYEEGIFKIPDDVNPGIIYDGCHCANTHMSILPNGDLYACRRFESKCGNVFADDLLNVFLDNEEKYREFEKFTKCSKCELVAFCRGCPAVAYCTTGDFYGADPQCWKDIE